MKTRKKDWQKNINSRYLIFSDCFSYVFVRSFFCLMFSDCFSYVFGKLFHIVRSFFYLIFSDRFFPMLLVLIDKIFRSFLHRKTIRKHRKIKRHRKHQKESKGKGGEIQRLGDLLDRSEAWGATIGAFKRGRRIAENSFLEGNSMGYPIENGGRRDHTSLIRILMDHILILRGIWYLLMERRNHHMPLPFFFACLC